MKSYIEFKQERSFENILSDAFGFVRNEFKPFFKTVFQIAGPYIILFIISMVFYTYYTGQTLDFDLTSNDFGSDFIDPFLLLISAGAYLISALLAYVFAISTTLHYIKSYIINNGNTDFNEIKQNVYKRFWGFLGLGILKWITLIVTIFLCVLPVFYFMVPMAIIFSIYVFEDQDASSAYGSSFSLIKSEFWVTLATIIVLGIIVTIASYVFALPTTIYTLLKTGIFSGEIDPENFTNLVDPISIILNVLGTLFQLSLNLIFTIGTALIYFNLNEKKNFSGTLDRIESIGNIGE